MSDTAKLSIKIIFWAIIALLITAFIGTICCSSYLYFAEKYNWGFYAKEDTFYADELANGLGEELFGGYTVEEVEKLREDQDAPIHDDIFETFMIQDLGSYVVMYREVEKNGKLIYPNLLFVKTEKGLVWDGAIGVEANIEVNFWTGKYNWDSLSFSLSEMMVGYDKTSGNVLTAPIVMIGLGNGHVYGKENIITFSDFKALFCKNYFNVNPITLLATDIQGNLAKLKSKTYDYLKRNVVIPYFMDLQGAKLFDYISEMEISQANDIALAKINSYATYFYNRTKNNASDKNELINLNTYFVLPIPENEVENYPVPANKQANYNGKEYYLAYNCNVFANVYYNYVATDISRDKDIIEGNTKTIVIDPVPVETKEYTKLLIKLNNKDNSDLTQYIPNENPVTVKIENVIVKFDSVSDIANGVSVALEKYKSYFYEISSSDLVFDTYTGSFTLAKQSQTITFDFTYQYGYVYTGISLTPISSTQNEDIDLLNNPVKIVLTGKNGEGTYQFVWDNNSMLSTRVGMYVKKGIYDYSVLSEQLIFGSTSGEIVISETNRLFSFSYAINQYSDDLKFTVDVQTATTTSTTDLKISATTATTNLLGQKIGQAGYKVVVKIFDKDGYILKTLNHTHSAGTSCIDAWQSNGVLTVGETYTGQLLYQNTNDLTKSYVSGTFTFTYQSNTAYTFVYSCVEI